MKTRFLASAITFCLVATHLTAADVELGWSAADLPVGDAPDWEPSVNTTDNDGILFTGGSGSTVAAGETNFARITRWVNSPGYNLAANPGDSFQDGLGGDVTQANVSWELVFRPGDYEGIHTLFNTGGNGDGTAFVLEDNILDFRFQDADLDEQRVIATANLAAIGPATDFYHVVGIADIESGDEGTATIWVNGTMIESVTSDDVIFDWDGGDLAELGKGNNIPGGNPFSPDEFDGDIAMFNYYGGQLLTDEEVAAALNAATAPEVDTDGDGIPDSYEEANELDPDVNDAAADKDGDGLTNLQEYEMRLEANNADTDGDGLRDGVETNTGTWVSATDTGTDPLNPDSDGDGLADGVESNTGVVVDNTNTGSDPNKEDSDGDGFTDEREVRDGTNPSDENSKPVVVVGIDDDFESGDINDRWVVQRNAVGSVEIEQADGKAVVTATTTNANGGLASIASFDPNTDGINVTFVISEIMGNPNANGFMVGVVDDNEVFHRTANNFGIAMFGQEARTFSSGGFSLIAGDRNASAEADFILDEGEEVDLESYFDGFTVNVTATESGWSYRIEGLQDFDLNDVVFENEGTWSDAGTTFDEIFGENNEWHVMTANQSSGNTVTFFDEIFLGASPGQAEFAITQFTRDSATNEVTLKWVSSAGASYSVDSSTDLKEWLEVQDGIPSQGVETTFTESDETAENYYRVRQE